MEGTTVTPMERTNTHRKTAVLAGAFFLIAMVASLVGGAVLIEPILSAPDYLVAVSENETLLLVGVLLELINGLAVVAIGVLMFPVLRQHQATMALGYLAFRIIESVFGCIIVISPLALLLLAQEYAQAGPVDAAVYELIGYLAIAQRASVANLLIPVFLGLGGLLLYSVLYQSRLVPRYIAVWGLIGAALILALNLLLTFGVEVGSVGLVLALPIITNEIFLGIWLIVKGFDPSAIATRATAWEDASMA